jgi:hypothetical protein
VGMVWVNVAPLVWWWVQWSLVLRG